MREVRIKKSREITLSQKMAGEFARPRFCTSTHFVQVSGDSVIELHVHALPVNDEDVQQSSSTSSSVNEPANTPCHPPPFSWLTERQMQELMVMIHEVVHKKALHGLSDSLSASGKKPKSSEAPDIQLKRGMSVRALFIFKGYTVHQHIALSTDLYNLSPILSPSSAGTFVNDQGRLVFSSCSDISTSGAGYRPFRPIRDSSLHVYVDQYEPTSSLGVVKIMMLLDPGRKQSLDVLSYFQPVEDMAGDPRGHDGGGEERGSDILGDLPVKGLEKRRRVGVGGRRGRKGKGEGGGRNTKRKMTERNSNVKTNNSRKITTTTSKTGPKNTRATAKQSPTQPANDTDQSKLTSHFSPLTKLTEKMSASEIDQLFGMDSDWLSEEDETDKKEKMEKERVEEEDMKVEVEKAEVEEEEEERMKLKEEENKVEVCMSEDWDKDNSNPTSDSRTEELLSTTDSPYSTKNSRNESSFVTIPRSPSTPHSPVTPDPEFFNSFSTPPCIMLDEEETEHLEERKMDIREQGTSSGITIQRDRDGDDGDGEQISPDLWSLEEASCSTSAASFSQPLDDITNHVPENLATTTEKESAFLQEQPSLLDIIDEGEVIVIESEEEVEEGKGKIQEKEREKKKKKKRKRKILSPQELFQGTKELGDVSGRTVSRWLAQQKEVLVGIYQQKVYSRRHDSFFSGAKGRAALLHQISNRKFTEEQRDAITSGLLHAFCPKKSMNLFSYVMSVLYPECLIRLLMDYHSISHEQAERKMMSYDIDPEQVELD